MKVRFVKPFDYTPSTARRYTTAYRPGLEPVTVKRECGEAAIAAGCAVEVTSSGEDQPPTEHDNEGAATT